MRTIRSQTRNRTADRALEQLECRLVFNSYVVTNLLDGGPGSLREAIDAANAVSGADDIRFAGGLSGTISLGSELHVSDDLTIRGTGEDKVTVSGGEANRVFSVGAAETHVTIEHLTIAHGLASAPGGTALGGGLLVDGASVSLRHVTFEGNRAVGNIAAGGAIANVGGRLDGEHLEFRDNSVRCDDGRDSFGGAVFNGRNAVMNVAHGEFRSNEALGGGANGGAIGVVDGSQANLAHCSFDSNQAVGSPQQFGGGGAIVIQSTGLAGASSSSPNVNISHCSFTGNHAGVGPAGAGSNVGGQGFGGAIIVEYGPFPPTPTGPAPTLVIEHSSFDGNTSQGRNGGTSGAGVVGRGGGPAWGGAIHNVSSTLVLRHSRFTNNQAKGGDGGTGGSAAAGGAGNFALGGAVAAGTLTPVNDLPTTSIESCTFLNNRAIGGNGGAGGSGANGGAAGRGVGAGVLDLNGPISIDDCWIAGNTAQGGDGGAAGSGATTLGGEGGPARGAGFANERGAISHVSDTTIALNQALGGAGGAGRVGGDALGAGVFNGRQSGLPPSPNVPAILTLLGSTVTDNLAIGGAGGAGASGGHALGGGIANFNPPPALPGPPEITLVGMTVSRNRATGGAAGTGGIAGAGLGGGLYNQTGALATVDATTIISGNLGSTSDDDVFGTLVIV